VITRADPAERGRLTVRAKAIERIAAASALGATGVRRYSSGLAKLAGRRDLPRVTAHVAGERVRAEVDIAVVWGHSLRTVSGEVHRHVAAALQHDCGLVVDGIAVHVAEVIVPERRRLDREEAR
jgi:uncharacterized alkaline shock family protein YloU